MAKIKFLIALAILLALLILPFLNWPDFFVSEPIKKMETHDIAVDLTDIPEYALSREARDALKKELEIPIKKGRKYQRVR